MTRTKLSLALAAGAVIAGALGLGGRAEAQGPAAGKTVLSGVYSVEQATRGKTLYKDNCAECHEEGAAFDGPDLIGPGFIDRWREDSLDTVYTYIRTSMPEDEPGKLDEKVYLDVLAYLLNASGLPAGTQELTAAAVKETVLVGPDGPKPLPTNTMVQVVGCFTQAAGENWMLESAGDPLRTKTPKEISADDLAHASTRSLGAHSMRLQNLGELVAFMPDANKGHKLLVKGILIKGMDGSERINTTAVASLAPGCGR